MTERIFTPWNSGFGDRFATIQLLSHLAAAQYSPENRVVLSDGGLGPLHRAIVSTLDAPIRIDLTDEPGNTSLDGYDVWATPFFPTQRQWLWNRKYKSFTYQFDGISSPQKNPSDRDTHRILDSLINDYRLVAIPVGKHMTVAECVEAMANSAFFIGCDSGMSHLAHSVGLPLFLLEYGLPVVTCHRGKSYIHCQGAGDFLDWKLPAWWHYRKFLGLT